MTESRIFWEVNFLVSLQEIILTALIEVGRLLDMGGAIPWLGSYTL